MYIRRSLEEILNHTLKKGKSILLLGPRQTGKTTLLNEIVVTKRISLANLTDRLRYEKNPAALGLEVEHLAEKTMDALPLVIIDEIQKIPILLDAVQDLIDRKIARFILTGSSARKLRRGGQVNLLPGRVVPLRLDPFMYAELPTELRFSLEDFLLDGTLPEVILEQDINEREQLLQAYVTVYLEEEIRAEAIVRDLGHFARFLELAASESGKLVNFTKLSQEIGVSHATIAGYYQILEDCLIVERIEPLLDNKMRRKLSKSQKYVFYDLGVRRVACQEGRVLPKEYLGHLLEQYVGLELIRHIRSNQKRYTLKYWRDLSGPEVDWVIEAEKEYIPIEVKWTDTPTMQDAKHLQLFLNEYAQAKKGFIICRTPYPMKLSQNIDALPWTHLVEVLNK